MDLTFTTVTSENSEAFTHLAPDEYLSGEFLAEKKAIGVLTGKEGSFFPAGLMIFFIRFTGLEKSVTEGPSIVVKWMFVDEDHRLYGIGSAMLDKVYSLGKEVNASKILFPGHGISEWENFKPFLLHRNFDIFIYKRINIVCRLKDIKRPHTGFRAVEGCQVKPMKKLGREELELVKKLFMIKPDQIIPGEASLYDHELCCAAIHNKKLLGVFLVSSEETDSGNHRLSRFFLGVIPETPPDVILSLLSFFHERATELYGKETEAAIEADNPNLVRFIEKVLPDRPVEEAEMGFKNVIKGGKK